MLLIPAESPLAPYRDLITPTGNLASFLEECTRLGVLPVGGGAGFTPDEGETLIGQVIFQRTHADRDATLEMGLFTDTAPGETITEATIAEPTGGGYGRKTLTDASWSVTGGVASYAQQTFTVSGSDYSANVYGYFIASVSSGGTARLLVVEIDAAGPYDLNDGDTYAITPNITIA
jgi:hypothetical protein